MRDNLQLYYPCAATQSPGSANRYVAPATRAGLLEHKHMGPFPAARTCDHDGNNVAPAFDVDVEVYKWGTYFNADSF